MSIRPVRQIVEAQPTMEGAGVHLRRAFGFQNGLGPGGRVWPVLSQMPRHRVPVDAQHPRDRATGMTGLVECKNRVNYSHCQLVRHRKSPSVDTT